MIFMLLCFSFGVILSSLYIKNTTTEFNRLIELHKIEDLRKNLVIRTQTVQSDLYTLRTPLSHTLDSIVSHVSKLDDAAKGCMSCHHKPEITKRLEDIQSIIIQYQNALSYYITASADTEKIDRLKLDAAAIGDKLLFTSEEMSFDANKRLGLLTKSALEKVNKAQSILFVTIIFTFLAGIIAAIKITRSITRPVSELVNATRVIASGDLGYTILYKDKTEFGELANNFNAMSIALKDGYTKLQNEIAERKKVEEELIKAQRLESLGILAGGLAHDFNNLLTAILGNIDLAKDYVTQEDEISGLLTDAENASIRAKDLTQQLLTFSRGGDPVKKTIRIADIVKESVSFALRGSNVTCNFEFSKDLWLVEVDRGQISQVIHNLVLNARDAMPEGGSVIIKANNFTVGAENNLPLLKGKYVKISFEDKGIGIAEEHLSRIFDPYFTTKNMGSQKGMGLGLAICYSIIKRHDGLITVNSMIGKGTAFTIYLHASQKNDIAPAAEEERPVSGKGRVLFMDDEEMVRNTAGKILKRLGYQVEFAVDGEEAIELYKRSKESSQPFDAIIMDLTVPGRMGGLEAIKGLLEIDPDIKAIVSSGYSNNPEMSDFRRYGFSGVISKPYKVTELSKILDRVITGTEFPAKDKEAGTISN